MAKQSRSYWAAGFSRRFPRWRGLGWALVTAPLWLIGAFVLVRDGLLHPDYRNTYVLQFLPSFRWYWHWYVIALLLYALFVFIFVAPVANQIALAAERERANKKVRRYQRMRQSQFHPQPSAPSSSVIAESNIQPQGLEIAFAYRNDRGFIVECDEGEATLRALVIPFKNNRHHPSLRKVGDAENVTAEISWVSWDGETFQTKPGPAAWLSEEREKVPFRRDEQANRLLLAIASLTDYSDLCATQRETSTLGKAVREIKARGAYWRIGVKLIAESEPKPIAVSSFILERDGSVLWDSSPVGMPHLLSYGGWRSFRLTRIILNAYDFLKQIRDGVDVAPEHDPWEKTTAQFILRNFDEKSKSKFLFEKHGNGRFSRLPSQPASLEERIGRQLDTLNELDKKQT